MRLNDIALVPRLIAVMAVRNAVRGGVDERILLSLGSTEDLDDVLARNELRDEDDPAPKRVRLRSVRPDDLDEIYKAWSDPISGRTWRSHGLTPAWDMIETMLWNGTDVAHIAEIDGAPAALACAYAANPDSGWIYAALLRLNPPADAGPFVAMESHFFDHLFERAPYRKVMLEVPASNMSLFDGLVEADDISRLPGHAFINGEWCDVFHLSLWRKRWDALSAVVRLGPEELATRPIGTLVA